MNNAKNSTRIVLIHATPLSIDPVIAVFQKEWPEAEIVNLLDDALANDLNSGEFKPDQIKDRIRALGNYSLQAKADGILYTCSAFGREIDSVKQQFQIPVLKPNEAMFEEALTIGGKIGMIATFKPSIPSMEREFSSLADDMGITAQLDSIFIEGAMETLAQGDAETHNKLISNAVSCFTGYQAVMLAQFSTSLAREAVEVQLDCPVLTSPMSAVRKLRGQLDG